jgi:flagellar hook-associated protein 3 FlgL
MSSRVTSNIMFKQLMTNMRISTKALGDLQEQMVSLRRINRPSDDPTGASRAQELRNNENEYKQYMQNIDQAQRVLDFTASALESISREVVAARGKVLSAINPTADATSREVTAAEINDILKSLLGQANSNFAGTYIFGGTDNGHPPFEIESEAAAGVDSVSFSGNSGRIRYIVGANHLVEINEDPVEVFMPRGEANGLFQTLVGIRKLLQNNEGLPEGEQSRLLSEKLGDLDAIHEDVLRSLGRVGTRGRTVQTRGDLYAKAEISSAAMRSEIEDADIAEVALRLKNQEVIYQVVLAGSSAVYNSNLMDFLR